MNKYSITLYCSGEAEIEIEAENETEAKKKALNCGILSIDLGDIEIEDISEIKLIEGSEKQKEENTGPTLKQLEAAGQLNFTNEKKQICMAQKGGN